MNIVMPASPKHVKERPAKRAKVDLATAGNIARPAPPKRGRASCLSELPTMPLDILFEVRSFHVVIQVTSKGRDSDFPSSSSFGFALAQSREQGIPLSALVQRLFVSMECML